MNRHHGYFGNTLRRSFSMWKSVPKAPPDAILGLTEAFKSDSFRQKINLGVGAYRNANGKPLVLESVKAAELKVVSKGLDKEYAPIVGIQTFINSGLEFVYGQDSSLLKENRAAAVQTLSGTGALRIAGEFLAQFVDNNKALYLPNPTWGNHLGVARRSGLKPTYYSYYNAKTRSLDFDAMKRDIENADDGSTFLLHACAHNPTGCDPSHSQWDEISYLMKKKQHIVFFDCAYQGFASGDAEHDAYSIRKFVEDGHQIMLSQSFAKNFGLYGERVGIFSIVTASKEETERVNSQLKILVRGMYSSPPIHGARIAAEILCDDKLRKQWRDECKDMAERIQHMRALLRQKLEVHGGDWSHITSQIGMFCYTGLSEAQVTRLKDEFHIYSTSDGRFSMAGVTEHNIDYLANSMVEVLKDTQ